MYYNIIIFGNANYFRDSVLKMKTIIIMQNLND